MAGNFFRERYYKHYELDDGGGIGYQNNTYAWYVVEEVAKKHTTMYNGRRAVQEPDCLNL